MKESKIFSDQNLTEKVHYVYRVTIDGQYYIGKRTGFLNDLITGRYRTSSKLIWEKLKNGKTFSKIKIIQVFYTSEEALEFEKRILTRVDAKTNPKFLNQSNGNKDFCLKQHTEKSKEKMKENYNTGQGRKRREGISKREKERFNPNTEQGRQNRENISKNNKEFYNTEQGRKIRENHSEFMKEHYNPDTEDGRRNKEIQSERMKEYFNPETEEGRKNKENHSRLAKVFRQKGAETQIQKRKDTSILGELMFDEDFIKENFLIIDDKNNLRFLSPVYSKLSGYSEGHICKEKRIGKLRFLYGIKSIKLSVGQANSKIEEIEEIIKRRNNEKE